MDRLEQRTRSYRGPCAEYGERAEQPDEECAGDDEPIGVADVAQEAGPAEQVVGQHRGGEPGAVGAEVPRGHVDRAGAGLEVADGEFDGGVGPVERVDGHDVVGLVGEERVVAPVPQLPGTSGLRWCLRPNEGLSHEMDQFTGSGHLLIV